jgi:aminopeptidase N
MPVADYEQNLYSALVYGKGPLFFHALRQELGDEAFFTLLQAYFASYRYGIASGPDLLAVVDGVSGRDLRVLFQEWLTYSQ